MAQREPPSPPPQEMHHSWIGEVVCGSQEYAVIRVSLDGLIEGWFGAAHRLFGYSSDEAVGQPFRLLYTPSDVERRLDDLELELARRAGRSEDDRWHVRKDGSLFWGSGVVNPIHDDRRRHVGYSKILRDRTDLRTRHEALRNRLAHATGQLARQEELLSTLVHELRNSVAPIAHAVRVIDSEVGDEFKQRMLQVIGRQAEVMRQVLAEASETVMHGEPLHARPVILQDALRSSIDSLLFDASAKGLELALVCPATPVTLEADPVRLQQMVVNLLSNAIKYTRGGGHVTVSASVEGDMVVVRVDDDGDGIAPENLQRVFELFTREESNEAIPGMGVGLAVVKRLAWLHGGFVEARSPGKGAGSQFTLQLPLKLAGVRPASMPDAGGGPPA